MFGRDDIDAVARNAPTRYQRQSADERQPRTEAHRFTRVAHGAASELYSLDGFRIAFLSASLIAVVGTVGLLWTRSHTRRRLYEESGIVIAPLWVALISARGRRRPPRVRE